MISRMWRTPQQARSSLVQARAALRHKTSKSRCLQPRGQAPDIERRTS